MIMVESSDKTSSGEGNGNPLQYSCHKTRMNSMEKQKDMTVEVQPLGQKVFNMLLGKNEGNY